MRTCSSSNLPGESSPNPTSLNPNRRNRRRSKQPFILEESPVDTMADQRTMAELLRAPTEGYAEAIMVPSILAEQFELKHSLINMMTSDQFFELEKDNPHDHIPLFQATPPPSFVKSVEEICVTCGGAHPYYQCVTADGNTFPELWDNIQGYVSAAAVNYNQAFFQMNTASTSGSEPLPSNTIANPKGKLKAITTRSGIILDGPSVPMPPSFINLEEDERVDKTLIDQHLTKMHKQKQQEKDEVQIHKFWQMFKQLHINITLADALILTLKYQKMLKSLLSNKEKLLELANTPLNKNCSAVILKKLPEKHRDHGKFLISYCFSELKCKALVDLDVFVLVGKFTFLANFVIVDYESDPRVLLILRRPFLQTARALIGVYEEEMILRDGDERLTLNMRHDTSRYSNQPQKESINMINIYDDSCQDYLEDLFATNHQSGNPTFSSHTILTSPEVKDDIFDPKGDMVLIEKLINLDSTNDLPPPYNINPLSGNDDLSFDIESDLKEIEYLLNHDPIKEMDSILKDSVDEDNLADLNDNLVDTMPEMFTDEHALDYSSPALYDEYDDDLFKVESDIEYAYDDPFDSKREKIKESKLLIDELDLPRSNKNVKKISNASLILENFDPPLSYELPFHKEVSGFKILLSFSSKNVEKVFKPGVLTSKGVHTFLLLKLSHRGHKAFKVIKILESPMEIFPCSHREDIRILDVPCLHFYPI
nr:hypothetical protein [Tanacetum cinerariifolium]